FVLYRYGFRPALAVSLVRILVSGLLFGSMFGILYSLSGMLFSLPVMAFLKNRAVFSVVGVSAAGAALFNTGQIAAAMAAAGPVIVRYLPVLLIAGDITGIIIGAIDLILIRRLSSVNT
ncbi:MAG: Gx transporter family protein, partial [Lachnospiraceae bacterium]|nr:Gx transporter family protein [Lachnospiraceae bacterium]